MYRVGRVESRNWHLLSVNLTCAHFDIRCIFTLFSNKIKHKIGGMITHLLTELGRA